MIFSFFLSTGQDIFVIQNGYSPLWLAILYIIGAYIKKFQINRLFTKRRLFLIYFILVTVTVISNTIIESVSKSFSRVSVFKDMLLSYNSPPILLCSISLLLLFANIKPKNKSSKAILFFSTATFGVYIIHLHPSIWNLIAGHFTFLAQINIFLLPFAVIGIALIIWVGCSIIDKIREKTFAVLKVQKIAYKAECLIKRITNRVIEYLYNFAKYNPNEVKPNKLKN